MGSSGGDSTRYTPDPKKYNWDTKPDVVKKSAQQYAQDDKREYSGATSIGIPAPVGKEIVTSSQYPLILLVDVTGSMKKWPELIFQKLPPLYSEVNAVLQGVNLEDLKAKKVVPESLLEIAVIAFGDAKCDSHVLQAMNFSNYGDLVKRINQIYPEGHGGGNGRESYELAAYFLINHCNTPKLPKGVKPLVIIAGDEGFYSEVKPAEVKRWIGDELPQPIDSNSLMADLKKKFEVYILRPEDGGYSAEDYAAIRKQWEGALGNERVLKMEKPERLVDDIIAVCGAYAGNLEESLRMIDRRQSEDPEKLAEVIRTIHPLLVEHKLDKKIGKAFPGVAK